MYWIHWLNSRRFPKISKTSKSPWVEIQWNMKIKISKVIKILFLVCMKHIWYIFWGGWVCLICYLRFYEFPPSSFPHHNLVQNHHRKKNPNRKENLSYLLIKCQFVIFRIYSSFVKQTCISWSTLKMKREISQKSEYL